MSAATTEGLQDEVPREDVRRFLSEWSVALAGGKPILQALSDLATSEANARLARIIRAMHDAVARGDLLWDEMRRHPDVFGERVIDAMSEGELEGTLDLTLPGALREEAGLPGSGEESESAESQEGAAVSVVEIGDFTRAFADMIGNGVALVSTMAVLEAREKNPRLRAAIAGVRADIEAGSTMSNALRKFPELFDRAYVDAVRLGEVNGNLDESLYGLAHRDDYLSFEQAMQFLGTSKATLYRLLSQKSLHGLKVGRQWRFRKADLVAYMERRLGSISSGAYEEVLAELKFFEPLAKRDFSNPQGFVEEREEAYAGERRVATLANAILLQAIEAGASDLHLESARLDGADCLLLRNRVDGVLHEVRRLPTRLEKPLMERLKSIADLSPDERAQPQDGRCTLNYRERSFDLRVAFSPAALGGSLVIRILAQGSMAASLEQMGLEEATLQKLQDWMGKPHGLILLSGMTGSGKTSTLYALLSSKASAQIKTLTIEDAVEYSIPYATQVWVNARAGLTYASALRAFLRQDPDIIGVGELRDEDSATLSAQAAMTGHLVVATLHAKSASQGLLRLLDLGLPPFVAANATIGVAAQMLIRRLCPDCKALAPPDDALLQALEEATGEEAAQWSEAGASTWSAAVGCDKCRRTGYRGRMALLELLEVDGEVARALARGAGREEVEALARARAMQSFASQGARRAVAGETSAEEVLRALFIGNP